jgi:ubiquinone/menaquinone biosynthesis C-methylase UbiE
MARWRGNAKRNMGSRGGAGKRAAGGGPLPNLELPQPGETAMSQVEQTVQGYYGGRPLLQRIDAALRAAGIDPEKVGHRDLWPYDQLHGRGITATREHAEHAGIRPGLHVLDLGCGVGGASRYLAAECGCRVTAIDLTPAFVETARTLNQRCGLADRIELHQASALALPFPAAAFDHVWCHNVTMNIGDKTGLAREVVRVLKSGGRFSCEETVQGPAGAPVFPLPWATDASSSFLVTPAAMRAALEAGGLRIIEQTDITAAGIAFMRDVAARTARGEGPAAMNQVVMGDDFPVRFRNARDGTADGRLLNQFILAEKP